ncbi:ABC transporter ATP-binding protein [Methylocystis heyeri]|uniref:ATP-binding cassette domain-containing protein n=1 Tax=Methylocystis heyeri TaxID=391905 RepID=A0A6B8KCZ6_9HYPH|nr:ABC transporter ATP-binding protein [Methylocystis heyeri]QGM44293.1 ATP-binding cassette domain-containing protein [Methylocystis heyeri]
MSDAVVAFEGLGHSYRNGVFVFRGYSARVRRGSIFAVLGSNGRGKTTLLKILLGALKPTVGSVSGDGHYAFVPQLFHVSFDYTALDMVLMGRARTVGMFSQPSRQDEEAAFAALDRFGLADHADRPYHELSGGQRQLVIFARALVSQMQTLILDEPTSALDLKNQALVLDWISTLSRRDGLTIIMTTHHPHHALAIADDALLMIAEEEHVIGPAKKALTEENLAHLYGVPMKLMSFQHEGRQIETLAPVYALSRAVPSGG